MSISWIFSRTIKTNTPPVIGDQLISMTDNVLCLRNPWRKDSVFMGKMYTSGMCAILILILCLQYGTYLRKDKFDIYFFFLTIPAPLMFLPFIYYRISFLKNLSDIHLLRKEKKIIYKRYSKLFTFHWNTIEAGTFSRPEPGGSPQYALAFAPCREDGTLHQKDCLWVDSNEPTDPATRHIAEVWEYIRHFMEHGPAKLPPPREPNWLHMPLHRVRLTPAGAWRHYAPWRTGEPGEMQGKKNWQLPFWAVLFPYNLFAAVCWYGMCWVFRVPDEVLPTEIAEGRKQ